MRVTLSRPVGQEHDSKLRSPRVAIIGAGLSGLGLAVRLREAGIDGFTIYERRAGIGGTWFANTYPGLTCDIPSRYYSFTFAPNPEWSQIFAPGAEIREYLEGVADRYNLLPSIRLNCEVTDARWSGDEWILTAADGAVESYDFLVAATGVFVQPTIPDLVGMESFAGQLFHAANWDHDVQIKGRRVAVIGTGSTGLQLTRALAPIAGRFELYQRTPQWVLPMVNRSYTRVTRLLHRRFPALSRTAYRMWQLALEQTMGQATVKPGWARRLLTATCRLHLLQVRDRGLRQRMTPAYAPMCKRLVMGSGFYSQFKRPNVALVDQRISHFEPRGIVTEDGRLHELDVVVLATGYDISAFMRPMSIVGSEQTTLSDVWTSDPFAYSTVALPGFPNMFMLVGPHSPLGNGSIFAVSESQAAYVVRFLARWRRGEFDAAAPTRAATDDFNDELRRAAPSTIWATGCASYYVGESGLPQLWPWEPQKHRELMANERSDDWELVGGERSEPVSTVSSHAEKDAQCT